MYLAGDQLSTRETQPRRSTLALDRFLLTFRASQLDGGGRMWLPGLPVSWDSLVVGVEHHHVRTLATQVRQIACASQVGILD
jgi:hypothetical protein